MRDVEDGELGEALWMEESDAPGNSRAPIVAGEENALLFELIGNGENIGGEFGERVGREAEGFAACVVAALIWNDHAEAGSSQGLDLFVPGIPEFWKTVK